MDEIQQRWLYGLSAPMVALNPPAEYAEPAFFANPQAIDLQGSWGLNDRPQLLDMLKRMTDGGHARHLDGAYRAWQRCLPSEWQALLETLEPRERVLHEFASRTFGSCGPGGILSWDYGRMGFLLRCGVRNRWIDQAESLWLHSRLAVRAQYHYGSWLAYFNGFLIGRSFWGCLGNSDDELAFELDRQGQFPTTLLVGRELHRHMPTFLADLPWHLDLDLPQCPASLEEFDWS
ncbi:DUF1266 domain-containing protein [Pseudomonas chlororaphis]|uniref:DUF1266 domain-containing protein n=1 Tax=Pseudomonas chlororaphis TaxID=587753 RepID=A0A0D5Y263_9PSED|nr:DUF1266 domain-containing protein [Pseudomonas chlororaphis]AKA25443.1 hypothetical protein PCL1606_39940 [Pseudomonas chlororaphis]